MTILLYVLLICKMELKQNTKKAFHSIPFSFTNKTLNLLLFKRWIFVRY